MLFNSLHYLLFLPVVAVIYYALNQKWKAPWLLLSSYFFYMSWNPWYALFLVFITLNDFYCGLWIHKNIHQRKSFFFAVLSISLNVCLLLFFKFLDSVNLALNALSDGSFSFQNLVIPLGISYHTFQSISYVIDVKKGRLEPERKLLNFGLFIVFFPQLIAGPIERGSAIFTQLRNLSNPSFSQINRGLKRFAWGLFRKAAIADRIALLIDPAFDHPDHYGSLVLALALFAFTLQIYFDFSGYVDMAIGSAGLFGVTLSENFNHPLSFRSLRAFWRNWHISLSSWLRDYIYIPLGGNRNHPLRNVILTFVLSGVWHGTGWNFLIFGFFHGCMVGLELWSNPRQLDQSFHKESRTSIFASFFYVQSALAFGWILFRNPDWNHATGYLTHLLSGDSLSLGSNPFLLEGLLGICAAILIVVFEDVLWIRLLNHPRFSFEFRALLYSIMLLVLIFFGVFNQREFIYFQF